MDDGSLHQRPRSSHVTAGGWEMRAATALAQVWHLEYSAYPFREQESDDEYQPSEAESDCRRTKLSNFLGLVLGSRDRSRGPRDWSRYFRDQSWGTQDPLHPIHRLPPTPSRARTRKRNSPVRPRTRVFTNPLLPIHRFPQTPSRTQSRTRDSPARPRTRVYTHPLLTIHRLPQTPSRT